MAQSGSSQKKILVAMSGGVDSSVTAASLVQQGFEVHGVFMRLSQSDVEEQFERVQHIARFLDLPVSMVDLSEPFSAKVLNYFSKTYCQGKTPNPCVICNHEIKFGKLLEFADKQGIEKLATGHYVKTVRDAAGIVHLLKGDDPRKDQSYFLCRLTQAQLQRVIFPLGELTKPKVYELAGQLGLQGKHGKESQDVCFMEGRNLKDFFTDIPPNSGDFVTIAGEIKKKHDGLHNYTVGQRKGLGIPDATPYYVVKLDTDQNQVIIGKEDDLWQDALVVDAMNWLSGSVPDMPQTFDVKIRYRHQASPAVVEALASSGYSIRFAEPQRAITPGQFAVLYKNDELVGGGEIIGDRCD
nr:tRNA 2-thiouridine(34) synthase MnmA [Desulfobulbaceae bacterium]